MTRVVSNLPVDAKTSQPRENWKGNWQQGKGGYWYPTENEVTEKSPVSATPGNKEDKKISATPGKEKPTISTLPAPAPKAPSKPPPQLNIQTPNADAPPKDTQMQIGIQNNTRESVSHSDYEKLKVAAPLLADTLLKYGYEAYQKALGEARQYQIGKRDYEARQQYRDEEAQRKIEQSTRNKAREILSNADALTADGRLNVIKVIEAGIKPDTLKKAGFDVSKGYLDQIKSDIAKAPKIYTAGPDITFSTIPENKPKEQGAGEWWYKNQRITTAERDKIIKDYEAERDRLLAEGKMFTPEWYKLGEPPQDYMTHASGVYETVKSILEMPKEEPKFWYNNTLIDQKERDAIIKDWETRRAQLLAEGKALSSLGDNPSDMITKASTAQERAVATIAADMFIPGFYVIREWDKLLPSEKGFYIALDVATFIYPVAKAAGAGARLSTATTRLGRLGAAFEAAGREALMQGVAPFQLVVHPVASAKGLARQAQHMAEFVLDPKKLKEAVVTTTSGTIRLKVNATTSEAEALKIRDKLMELAARGERPLVEINGNKYELSRSLLMKELGGGLTHATPQGEAFAEGLTVAPKQNMPKSEQGLFLSPEPLPRFAGQSAFGKTGGKPIIYVISPETAQRLSITTGKIYNAPGMGKVAEMELKIPVGGELPAPAQILNFRYGPELQKVELWLEKKLTAKQIAKFKIAGFIEDIKTLVKPSLLITGKNKAGMTAKELDSLADILRVNNEATARALSRNIATVTELSRILPRRTVATASVSPERAKEIIERAEREIPRTETRSAPKRETAEQMLDRLEREARRAKPDAPIRRVVNIDSRGKASIRTTETIRDARGKEIRRETTLLRNQRGRWETRTIDIPTRTGRGTPDVTRGRRTPERPPRDSTRRTPERPPRDSTRRTPPRDETTGRPPKETPEKKFSSKMKSDAKRDIIKNSDGAIAWRQGQLAGKDLYHVLIYPYDKQPYHTVILGAKPEGAKLVRGPKSAYKTAEIVKGTKQPAKPIDIDMGITDIKLKPSGRKDISINFSADPEQKTKGDFAIGNARFTPPTPAISHKIPKLGALERRRQKMPKMPKLR